MSKSRKKEFKKWAEYDGEGYMQRGQPRKARIEKDIAGKWGKTRLLSYLNDGYDDADFNEDSLIDRR